MKEAFKQCMRKLYPSGIDNVRQLRGLVRIFAMAWRESMTQHATVWQGIDWDQEFFYLADPNWWPDETWRWW